LNSAENRLRVLMVDHPLHPRIHLSRLCQEVGPPLGIDLRRMCRPQERRESLCLFVPRNSGRAEYPGGHCATDGCAPRTAATAAYEGKTEPHTRRNMIQGFAIRPNLLRLVHAVGFPRLSQTTPPLPKSKPLKYSSPFGPPAAWRRCGFSSDS
jgi:hypothetical protein